jgi:tetratricopeptide (TPR) repeat protein
VALGPLLWIVLAAGGSAHLRAAEQAFEGARYDQVLTTVRAALAEALSPDERRRAYELLAFTHAAFNDSAEAVEAFTQLLVLDPAYVPGQKVSPKIRALFDRARAEAPKPDVPKAEPPPERPLTLLVAPPSAPAASVELPPAPPTPPGGGLVTRWWFWTGVGAVVAAGTITAWVVAHQEPSGTLGTGRLP